MARHRRAPTARLPDRRLPHARLPDLRLPRRWLPGRGRLPIAPVRDDGSAVVDFALVGILLLFLFAAVLQVAVVLHVRNVLAADAAEGARYAANAGVSSTAGGAYTRQRLRDSIRGVADRFTCTSAPTAGADGLTLVDVTCRGSLRLFLLPVDTTVPITVHGRAIKEGG